MDFSTACSPSSANTATTRIAETDGTQPRWKRPRSLGLDPGLASSAAEDDASSLDACSQRKRVRVSSPARPPAVASLTEVAVRGALDLARFNAFMGDLLASRGHDIFGCEGFLYVQGHEWTHFAFSIIRGVISVNAQVQLWRGEDPPVSRIRFAGHNLHEESLQSGFQRCLWQHPGPATLPFQPSTAGCFALRT